MYSVYVHISVRHVLMSAFETVPKVKYEGRGNAEDRAVYEENMMFIVHAYTWFS